MHFASIRRTTLVERRILVDGYYAGAHDVLDLIAVLLG